MTIKRRGNYGQNWIGVTAVLLFSCLGAHAQCAATPPGLVAFWKGEGDATDQLGINNGTITGNVTFVPGMVGMGFNFDGQGSYVTVPDNPSLDLTNALTIELWYEDLGTGPYSYGLIAKRGTGTGPCNFGINVVPGGVGLYYHDPTAPNNGDDGGSYQASRYPQVPTPGMFHHLAGVFTQVDSSDVELDTYIDGSLVRSLTVDGNLANTISSDPVTIGASAQNGGESFNGIIDEVSIYNRALTANEILAIYNAGSAGKCTTSTPPQVVEDITNQTAYVGGTIKFSPIIGGTGPISFQWTLDGTNLPGATNVVLTLPDLTLQEGGSYQLFATNSIGETNTSAALLSVIPVPPCVPAPSGIISWWQGEGNALDSVDGNQGFLTNGATFAPGEVGQAFSFNGAGAYVKIPKAANLDVGNQVTLECWIYFTTSNTLQAEQGIIASDFYTLEVNNGIDFVISTNSGRSWSSTEDANGGAGATLSPNQWHHIAGTYDGMQLQLYVDGAPAGNPLPAPGAISPMLTNSFLTIGSEQGRSVSLTYKNRYFKGLVDEATLYNRALSASEIQSIYNAAISGKCLPANPPIIVINPTNQTAVAGSSTTFVVGATGLPPLSYQWFFNGILLPGQTNSTLTYSNVLVGNSGIYYALVSNPYGTVPSSNAVLSVLRPGRIFTFSNPSNIVVASSGSIGSIVTTPYPSVLKIIGFTNPVYKITATVSNLTHTYASDLSVLLVGPNPATEKVLLMSDTMSASSIAGVTYTFDDGAPGYLPTASPASSGSYRPTDYTKGSLGLPAPPAPYSTNMFVLTNTSPNGTWALYVYDDYPPSDGGSISGGWHVDIQTLRVAGSQFVGPPLVSNGVFAVSFASRDGQPFGANEVAYFDVDVSSNLVNWDPLQAAMSVQNDGTIQVLDSTPSVRQRFYRVSEH